MGRDATNYLPAGSSRTKVRKVALMLGFKPLKDWRNIEGQVGSYGWYEREGYKSWTGVELSIHDNLGVLTVHTRSRYGGSYWDIRKQKETMGVYKDFLGGYFESDYGRNRLFPTDERKVSPTASGSYIARWRLENAVSLARSYRSARSFIGNLALEAPNEIPFLDSFNPLLLSNNMLLPYLVAVWEDYFRSLFIVAIKHSGMNDRVLSNINPAKLRTQLGVGGSIEEIVASQFSFQRPQRISDNFKLIDKRLDFASSWSTSPSGKRILLLNQLDALVDHRNSFVHEGALSMNFFSKRLDSAITRILKAADLSHQKMGDFYGFEPC